MPVALHRGGGLAKVGHLGFPEPAMRHLSLLACLVLVSACDGGAATVTTAQLQAKQAQQAQQQMEQLKAQIDQANAVNQQRLQQLEQELGKQ